MYLDTMDRLADTVKPFPFVDVFGLAGHCGKAFENVDDVVETSSFDAQPLSACIKTDQAATLGSVQV